MYSPSEEHEELFLLVDHFPGAKRILIFGIYMDIFGYITKF